MATPPGPTPSPIPNWLCTFQVSLVLSSQYTQTQMEQFVADLISQGLNVSGFDGSCSVSLMATAGNVTVANPTPPAALPGVNLPPPASSRTGL